ncbi:mucosa-associated lymphoid tissue lymphoma translocation protein 1 isoform X1 [Panthera onca]|uniref:mucosa-associated lymphoid tissue lymphoma translocation protein 1 isoform X1 n=1 Tax=Panthera tigris TaxID=9694 RepID=UPI001C6F74E8|nr:mucosa-associated lymphoid tissue lymphoma translocation protein 1 isoform X1 [Panthera tigris]XP_049476234.1 mucosa-associated lymphoid tissue lymphoma translocation protein 1 isoform X1 [Panthera uncia]XP_060469940.1 mucosa-associated lymphoid tissue lymphoma translocation protein 1 isoform X1 [Panthera onca]
MRPAGAAAVAGSSARDASLCGELLQAPPPPASQPPPAAPSGPPLPAPSATLNRLPEPLLRRLSGSLDRAPEGRGWRRLAEVAGSRGRLRLSCLDLEQCSLKVLEPEGSPSLCLLKLMGEKGCTVTELSDFLQAMEHTEVLLLLSPPGIKITVNPESKAVLAGQFVKLCCRATGHPFVQYQWFKMNKEIPNGNASELIFNTVHVKDAGFYVCRVNNNFTFEFSQWSQLDVCDVTEVTGNLQGSLDGISESKLQICVEPRSQKLMPGSTLLLQCVAVGSPIPHYQWFKNESPLIHETKKLYMVPYVDLEHQGTYWCHVYNDRDSQDSKKVEVIIGRTDAVECTEDELNNLGCPDHEEQTGDQPLAKDKVALLIGNMNYWEHPKLKAPLVDVYELTNLLRQLDFKVVSLLDLTEYEMRNAVDEFLLLLDKGVYGLLYYAGHGYENFGNSFMVPVDAPNPYRSENCLCVQNILKLMQEKETGLNVFLLDMCRKRNDYDDTIPILDALKVTANIVFGYATCQGAEAFEIQHSGLANGIFMKFLKDRLLEDKKITVLLDEVAEDMGKCHLTKGKQALEIRSSLSEKRALTDPIQGTGYSAESLVRNLQWAKAHELPESMCLKFQCGVQIQLGFAAEFSNVMIIYTSIVHKPPDVVMCDAYVTDFPLDLDIDPKAANKGTPEETGSYLVSKDLPKQCLYTRLSSLQKLKEHLIFTVCVSYQYSGLEDTVEEKQEVNVGKPLIAKLDIHRGLGRKTCFQTCVMCNGPYQSPASTSTGAGQYHSSQDSFHALYHSHLGNSSSVLPSDSCHCSRTADAFISSPHSHRDSCRFGRSNVPVETTDEMPFSLSDGLRISDK